MNERTQSNLAGDSRLAAAGLTTPFSIGTRCQGDKLIRDDVAWQNAGCLHLAGEGPDEDIYLTWYPYGASLHFRHPCGQFEFHAWRGAGYTAAITIKCDPVTNCFQVREPFDNTSLELRFRKGAKQAEIGTEHKDVGLELNPQADLNVNPAGHVLVRGRKTFTGQLIHGSLELEVVDGLIVSKVP